MNEIKSGQLNIRVTPSEQKQLQANAQKLGRSLSEHMIKSALQKPQKPNK